MDDWLSKEWADHHGRFSADLSTGVARLAMCLKVMASAEFWRRWMGTENR